MEDEVVTGDEILDACDDMDTIVKLSGTAAFDKCSYPQGYMKRQSVFTCGTCCNADMEPAGFCIGCLGCHEGHEIYNLYTKRNFRCDCGNAKFGTNKCLFCPNKDPQNTDNKYGQNFRGLYCTCHRPYPDPDDDTPDDMVQCIICEDWFHTRHLVPSDLDATSGELICQNCTGLLPFISAYNSAGENGPAEDGGEEIDVENGTEVHYNDVSLINACKIAGNTNAVVRDQAVVMPLGWRNSLCRCVDCMNLYEKLACTFLLDETDCLENYVKEGEAARASNDPLEKWLGQLNRVGLVEFIHGYNNLKEQLSEFFRKHMESNKVIEVKDVEEFFEQLRKNSSERCDIPYSCR